MTCAANADLLAVVDPLRNVHLQLVASHDPALAAAVVARLLEDLADAAALGARALLDELAENILRHTSVRRRSRRTSSTVACPCPAPPPASHSARTAARLLAER
jgi:hypothetical protein